MGILDNIKKTLSGKSHGGKKTDSAAAASPPKSAGNPEAASATAPAAGSSYTVQSGDTLWKIASRAYGDGSRYPEIFEANRDVLKQPEHILPGQQLIIPPRRD